MVSIQRNGTFRQWKDPRGVDILMERQGDIGGAVPAVPMIGQAFQHAWPGAERLPLHGSLWQIENDSPDINQIGAVDGTQGVGRELEINMRPRLGVFPWHYRVYLRYIMIGDQQLTYEISVTRDRFCPNNEEMPLSFGLLPFFSTYGDKFIVRENGLGIAHENNDLEPGRISTRDLVSDKSTITLETSRGTLTFDSLRGFDRIYLQRNRGAGYVCVAPVVSKLANLHLLKGMSHVVTARLTFEAKR